MTTGPTRKLPEALDSPSLQPKINYNHKRPLVRCGPFHNDIPISATINQNGKPSLHSRQDTATKRARAREYQFPVSSLPPSRRALLDHTVDGSGSNTETDEPVLKKAKTAAPAAAAPPSSPVGNRIIKCIPLRRRLQRVQVVYLPVLTGGNPSSAHHPIISHTPVAANYRTIAHTQSDTTVKVTSSEATIGSLQSMSISRDMDIDTDMEARVHGLSSEGTGSTADLNTDLSALSLSRGESTHTGEGPGLAEWSGGEKTR